MENSVIFRDNQETQADDFNNMEGYISQEFNDLITDAVNSGTAYTGLAISISAATQATVQPGRLYWDGEVYVVTTPTVLDFFNNLPITQETWCAIVAWGQSDQTNVQPRNFLINADTGQSQPQAVAMEQSNVLNLSIIAGVESAAPAYPAISATTLLVGYVLLNPSGIVSFIQNIDTQQSNLTVISGDVASLEEFQLQVEGQISTLSTALAALAKALANYATQSEYMNLANMFTQLQAEVLQLQLQETGLVSQLNALSVLVNNTYLYYGTDFFLDTSQSQTTANIDGAYNANITEGLRFDGVNARAHTTLQLLNPNDAKVTVGTDGFMLPNPSGMRVRMDCSFPTFDWTPDRVLSYSFFAQAIIHLARSRIRHCCGPTFTVCPQNQVWWYQAQLDPTARILSFISEDWEVKEWSEVAAHSNDDDPDWPMHHFLRNQFFWKDDVDLPYWAKVFTTNTYSGNYVVQSFLNSQDGWLGAVTVYSTQLYFEPLNLMIVACDSDGTPDYTQVICEVNLTGDEVEGCFNQPFFAGDIDIPSENWFLTRDPFIPVNMFALRVPIPPTFLSAGTKYGIVAHTTFNHIFACSTRYECFAVHQGAFWYSTGNGQAQWTTSFKSMHFKLHYLIWGQWQDNSDHSDASASVPGPITVNMQPITMAGGIGSLEVLAEEIEPKATSLTFEVQISGVWTPFGTDPHQPPFSSAAPLLPFNLIFNGTSDLMPGINLTQSQITIHCFMSDGFYHIGDDIVLGNASTHIKILCNTNGYNGSHHTFTSNIRANYAETGGGARLSPSVTSSVTNSDGSVTWTFTYNTTSATPSGATLTGGTTGVSATGSILFPANPWPGDTIDLNGTVVTFVASGATGNQVNIGGSLSATLTSLNTFLGASADAQISKCTYSIASSTTLDITDKTTGTGGNSFTIAASINTFLDFVPELSGTQDGAVASFNVANRIAYATP